MSVTLTAGGRPVVATPAPPAASSFPAWERDVSALLAAAVATQPDRAKLAKMNAWLSANEWHPQAVERERRRDELATEVRRAENDLADRCERISRLQERLSASERGGIEALTGYRLGTYDAQAWAIVARTTGVTDLLTVAELSRGILEGWMTEDGQLLSWSKFWGVARSLGWKTKAELEAVIGPFTYDPDEVLGRLLDIAGTDRRAVGGGG